MSRIPATSAAPPFGGAGVALITLFRDDGQVDYDATWPRGAASRTG